MHTKGPGLATTQIAKNRAKQSAPEAGFQAVNGDAAQHGSGPLLVKMLLLEMKSSAVSAYRNINFPR